MLRQPPLVLLNLRAQFPDHALHLAAEHQALHQPAHFLLRRCRNLGHVLDGQLVVRGHVDLDANLVAELREIHLGLLVHLLAQFRAAQHGVAENDAVAQVVFHQLAPRARGNLLKAHVEAGVDAVALDKQVAVLHRNLRQCQLQIFLVRGVVFKRLDGRGHLRAVSLAHRCHLLLRGRKPLLVRRIGLLRGHVPELLQRIQPLFGPERKALELLHERAEAHHLGVERRHVLAGVLDGAHVFVRVHGAQPKLVQVRLARQVQQHLRVVVQHGVPLAVQVGLDDLDRAWHGGVSGEFLLWSFRVHWVVLGRGLEKFYCEILLCGILKKDGKFYCELFHCLNQV